MFWVLVVVASRPLALATAVEHRVAMSKKMLIVILYSEHHHLTYSYVDVEERETYTNSLLWTPHSHWFFFFFFAFSIIRRQKHLPPGCHLYLFVFY